MRSFTQHIRSCLTLLGLSLVIAACGGGGGGGGGGAGGGNSGPDLTPNSFSFTSATSVSLGATVLSNTVTVSGMDDGTSISVADGQYSINGGAYTSSAGTIDSGDSLRLQATASSTPATATTVSVTVGSVVETFTITTVDVDIAPEAFSFTAVTGAEFGAVVESDVVTITGINAASTVTIDNGEYKIGDGSYTASASDITEGQSLQVRITAGSDFGVTESATVTIGGVSATFSVTTVEQDTTPEAFTFSPVTVPVSTEVSSNTVTITGITGSVAISVSGGSYTIGTAAATTEAGVIENDATVFVTGTSSDKFSTETTVALTIGTVTQNFVITSETADSTPEAFSFAAQTGADQNTVYTSNAITVAGINTGASISVEGGMYSIDGGNFTSNSGTVGLGQSVQVQVTSAATAGTAAQATLTIGGVPATFVVTTTADEVAPTASIAFPPPLSMTEGESVTVRGTAADDMSQITSVKVNGVEVTELTVTPNESGIGSTAVWSTTLTGLVDVQTTEITVAATDAAENTEASAASASIKRDTGLGDFPNSEAPFTRPKGMTLIANNTKALVTDWGVLNDPGTYKIFEIDLATGNRSVLLAGEIKENARDKYWAPMCIDYDSTENIAWVTDIAQDILFQIPLDSPSLIEFSSNSIPEGNISTAASNYCLSVKSGIIMQTNQLGLFNVDDNGMRSRFSSYTLGIPNEEVEQGVLEGIIWNSDEDLFYVYDGKLGQVLIVNNLGFRQVLSNNSTPNAEAPLFETDTGDFFQGTLAFNSAQKTLYVNQGTASALLTVSIETGARTEFSSATVPNDVNTVAQAEDVFYQEGKGYLLWLDSGNDGILAADIESGERVYITKGSTED